MHRRNDQQNQSKPFNQKKSSLCFSRYIYIYLFHGSVMGLELVVSYNGIPVEVKRNLIPNHQPILYTHTRWAPISYKWGYSSYKYGYNFIYPFIRPFIGLITPFITGSGPPCRIHVTQLRGLSSFGPSLEPRCIRCPIAPFGAFGTCDSQGVSRVRVEIFRLGKRFHSLALVT